MKKSILTAILFSFLFAIASRAADSTGVPELDHYKAIYNREVQKLAAKTQAQRLRLPQEHIKALTRLENQYREAGDLRNLLAVRNERKRFINDPRTESIVPVAKPLKLRELQQAYISNYRTIRAKRKQETDDIRNKYIKALQLLQKSLTRQDKIDEALVVMKEIESVKPDASTPRSDSSLMTDESISEQDDTSSLLDDSGGMHDVFENPAPSHGDTIDTKTIQSLIKGDVSRWNPYKNEITVTYDFSSEEQRADWKGGRIKGVRGQLTCNRTVAWLKLEFSSIKRVELSMVPSADTTQAGMVIGRNLTMLIGKKRTIDGKIYQSSPESPIVKIVNIEPTYGDPYKSILSITKNQVSWSVNGGYIRRGVLKEAISYPTYIGVGCLSAESSYDSITVTGTLSARMLQRLKHKL